MPGLEGKRFTAVENSESGEVGDTTVFSYHQDGSVIWAEYSGGLIIKGFLIGTVNVSGSLHFSYQHVNVNNELKRGLCDSVPKVHTNGKLRFYETWQWDTGEKGFSVIEEL